MYTLGHVTVYRDRGYFTVLCLSVLFMLASHQRHIGFSLVLAGPFACKTHGRAPLSLSVARGLSFSPRSDEVHPSRAVCTFARWSMQ